MRSPRVQRLSRPLLYALLGLALLAQGMLPVGWMPAFAADGLRLVPCSSYWPEEFAAAARPTVANAAHHAHQAHQAVDPHQGHGSAPQHHDGGGEEEQAAAPATCAFAGAPGLAPPNVVPSLLSNLPVRRIARQSDRATNVGNGLAAPPPPATGPPLEP